MGEGVVIDTNVFISALGWDAKPERCLRLIFNQSVVGFISPDIVTELQEVLSYPKFSFSNEESKTFIAIILDSFIVVNPTDSVNVITDDPDDNIVLECALAGDVDFIVSGDSHLLNHGTFRDISILTPDEFLHELGE